MSKICSCFGKVKNLNKNGLEESLFVFYEHLIKEQGFDVFCFGGVGEFDNLCFKVVLRLKEKYSKIKTVLVFPNVKWAKIDFDDELKNKFDECVRLEKESDDLKLPLLSRNFEMAKASEFIVFFASETGRGSETKVLKFAKEKNIPHINLYWLND